MKTCLTAMIVAAILAVVLAFAGGLPDQLHRTLIAERAMGEEVNLDLDEHSAIQVAEVVLVRVFGERVLEERPWVVVKKEKVFKISGTLMKHARGGVAEIEINQRNAAVVSLQHGK
jgi:putative effector of murein hydrolase